MTQSVTPRIRCRVIAEQDAPALSLLLAKGFPERATGYWRRAFETLARRDSPEGYPRFGYMLESDDGPVGVILMIFTRIEETRIRCNISSWYVEERFRGYASLLIAAAVRHKDVTYINVSPAPHTWPVIEAQGFRCYAHGQMLVIPALSGWTAKVRVREYDKTRDHGESLTAQERDLLESHARHGCLALVAQEGQAAHPFVFLKGRVLKGLIPTQQLVYCRSLSEFQRFAGPIGRALLRRGQPTILLDATEKLPGLVGKFLANRGPKYFKGPERPRLGDFAYSESVLFGP